MTARDLCVRLALRLRSRSYAWAPEVCPYGGHGVREHSVTTRLRRRDHLDQTSVVTTHASTPGALTIQRP